MTEEQVRQRFAQLRDALAAEAAQSEDGKGAPGAVELATIDLLEGALINLAKLAAAIPPPPGGRYG